MNPVTVSRNFQVVIPKDVREFLSLVPGQKVQVVALDDRIELVPVRPARKLRGVLEGMDVRIAGDDDRRR